VNLTGVGESRVNGYLFVLERSLKAFLPAESVRDAVREIESHLHERIASADGAPNERDAIERILAELGPPLRVAQAYSAERTIDEAVATGRFVPMVRAVWHLAVTTLVGFWAALGIFVGTVTSLAFLAVAVMKPIFPNNVGVWVYESDGLPHNIGIEFPAPADQHLVGGYWVIPFALIIGLGILVLTYRGTRRFLTWWRERRLS
jgi:HAAS domain-containing protein